MPNTKCHDRIWIHVVFATKYREPLLHKSARLKLLDHIVEYASQKGILIETINGWSDHLHVLLRLKPSQRLSWIVNRIKGESSGWINSNNLVPSGFRWQRGYSCFSVNPAQVERVRRYIEKQQEHHG